MLSSFYFLYFILTLSQPGFLCSKRKTGEMGKNTVALLRIHSDEVFLKTCPKWGQCEHVMVHTIFGGSPVMIILWISLGGKPKWNPLKFGYHDVMRNSPVEFPYTTLVSMEIMLSGVLSLFVCLLFVCLLFACLFI